MKKSQRARERERNDGSICLLRPSKETSNWPRKFILFCFFARLVFIIVNLRNLFLGIHCRSSQYTSIYNERGIIIIIILLLRFAA